MTSFKTNKLMCMALCALTLIMCACSKSNGLLDTVPATSPAVATVNVEQLMNRMDGTNAGGKLNSEATLKKLLSRMDRDNAAKITAMLTTKAIDRNMVAMFLSTKEVPVMTFTVNDKVMLTDSLDAVDNGDSDGYATYRISRGKASLLIKDNQGWIIALPDPAKSLELVNEELQLAMQKPISHVENIGQYLADKQRTINVAVAMKRVGLEGWTCFNVDTDKSGRVLKLDGETYDADGTRLKLDNQLATINSKLLECIAPDDMLSMAIGLKPDTDWEKIVKSWDAIAPMSFRQRAVVSMIVPYLKRIDGTVLISAGPTVNAPKGVSAGQISFVLAVEMDKGNVKATMNDLRNILSSLGLPIVEKDGSIILQVPGAPAVTLTTEGNTIMLANRPVKQIGNDAASATLKGKAFAMWANIPTDMAENTYGGPGFKLKMQIDNTFKSTFEFNGSTLPVLEQLAGIIDAASLTEPFVDDTIDDLGFTPIDTII